jgi:C1A family cysteine protease
MSAVITTAEEDGQCEETSWPYGDAAATDATATYYRARGAARMRTDLVDTMRNGLGGGVACVLVLRVTEAWFEVVSDGLIPAPDVADQMAGLHAVVAVGYDDSRQQLVIRNSWGIGWGDGGYGFLPYAYLERYGVEAARLEAVALAASA